MLITLYNYDLSQVVALWVLYNEPLLTKYHKFRRQFGRETLGKYDLGCQQIMKSEPRPLQSEQTQQPLA